MAQNGQTTWMFLDLSEAEYQKACRDFSAARCATQGDCTDLFWRKVGVLWKGKMFCNGQACALNWCMEASVRESTEIFRLIHEHDFTEFWNGFASLWLVAMS